MSDNDEPERKRLRLEASEALVMDVNSSAKWDFLAPWCEELKGQLVSVSGGLIRVLGPRRKREKLIRFNFEDGDDDEEEDNVDHQEEEREIEQALWRTREAIELLSLVAQVDLRAFHMLITQQCGLRLEDEESDEEEFRPVMGEDDFVFFEDEESEDEDDDENYSDDGNGHPNETEEQRGQHDDGGADRGAVGTQSDAEAGSEDDDEGPGERDEEDDEEDEHDDVFILPPDTFKRERKLEREAFISPRFDFISLRHMPGMPEVTGSLFAEWEKLILAEYPQYQPSAAYNKAKETILDMLPAERKLQPRIQRPLEIPVSLEYITWAKSADQLAGQLQELGTFMEAMSHRALKMDSTTAQKFRECASTFMYCLTQISMTLSHRGTMIDLLVDRLLEVLGHGVLVSELHVNLRDEVTTGIDPAIDHDILAKLLTGMVIQPASPTQKQIPSFTDLNINCEDSAMWQLEALCSAFAVSKAPITKLTLTRACTYQVKDDQRRRCWRLLAQTFFHTNTPGPFSSVRGLHLPDAELSSDDLAEITAVLQEKEYQATVAKQWDICQKQWLLREGTSVQITEKEGSERVLVPGDPVTLRQETLVDLVESNADDSNDDAKSEWLDVIIPGYGQCRVARGSAIAVPSESSNRPESPVGAPLESLSLSLKSEADGLPGLIKQIGWSLEKLSLSFHREVDVNAMVPTLLLSCPKMTKLSLCESFIDLDLFSTTYENLGDSDGADAPVITTLEIQDYYGIGNSEGKLFMKRLGDPSTRLARDLQELSLLAEQYAEPLDHQTLSELWLTMEKNTRLEKLEVMVSRTMWSAIWKRRLRQFHGQVLPPRPLLLSCKLSFLSVCHASPRAGAEETSSAAHNLDRRVLSLIFEFAATRVVRSVKIWG